MTEALISKSNSGSVKLPGLLRNGPLDGQESVEKIDTDYKQRNLKKKWVIFSNRLTVVNSFLMVNPLIVPNQNLPFQLITDCCDLRVPFYLVTANVGERTLRQQYNYTS